MCGNKKKNRKKVLIIEDDALLARVLAEGFNEAGFETFNVVDGMAAIGAVKKFVPDVIILDLILPGIDGFEILRQLKSEKETEKIPVIVTSNLDSAPDVKSVKALGAEEYFIKANVQLENIIDFTKKTVKH